MSWFSTFSSSSGTWLSPTALESLRNSGPNSGCSLYASNAVVLDSETGPSEQNASLLLWATKSRLKLLPKLAARAAHSVTSFQPKPYVLNWWQKVSPLPSVPSYHLELFSLDSGSRFQPWNSLLSPKPVDSPGPLHHAPNADVVVSNVKARPFPVGNASTTSSHIFAIIRQGKRGTMYL